MAAGLAEGPGCQRRGHNVYMVTRPGSSPCLAGYHCWVLWCVCVDLHCRSKFVPSLGRYFLCNAAVFQTRGKFAKGPLGVVPATSLTIDFVSSNFHLSRDHFQWRSFGGDTVRALETITILRQPSCLTLPVRGRDRYRQGLAHFPHGSA